MVAPFVYSYLDHTINEIYADTAAKVENVADLVATASYDPANTLPVRFDAGLAFVSIATSWLLC